MLSTGRNNIFSARYLVQTAQKCFCVYFSVSRQVSSLKDQVKCLLSSDKTS